MLSTLSVSESESDEEEEKDWERRKSSMPSERTPTAVAVAAFISVGTEIVIVETSLFVAMIVCPQSCDAMCGCCMVPYGESVRVD